MDVNTQAAGPCGGRGQHPPAQPAVPSCLGPAQGSSPLCRRASPGAAQVVGGASGQQGNGHSQSVLTPPCLLALDWPGHLSLASGGVSSGSVLGPRLPVTQGRARGGSLRSSTWLQGPCRCSRAAHSGKRSCTWPSTVQSGLPLP